MALSAPTTAELTAMFAYARGDRVEDMGPNWWTAMFSCCVVLINYTADTNILQFQFQAVGAAPLQLPWSRNADHQAALMIKRVLIYTELTLQASQLHSQLFRQYCAPS